MSYVWVNIISKVDKTMFYVETRTNVDVGNALVMLIGQLNRCKRVKKHVPNTITVI